MRLALRIDVIFSAIGIAAAVAFAARLEPVMMALRILEIVRRCRYASPVRILALLANNRRV
jgi:hypothetical protein